METSSKLKVLNIFGGPCTGKSTNAAGVFYHMKCRGHSVELVTEYAKDMTWEKRHNVLTDQTYILAKQSRRIARLEGEVQWAVTDGPFILGLLYTTPGYYRSFETLVMEKWERFDNTCFLLDRGDLAYDTVGRNQDLDDARRIDDALREIMDRRNIPYTLVPAGEGSVERILSHLNI